MSLSLLSAIFSNGSSGAVDQVRLSLEGYSADWFALVKHAGYAVALGCVMEAPETFVLLKRWWLLRFRDEDTEETKRERKSWLVPLAAVGLLIVVIGIVVETYAEGQVSDVDALLRAHESDKITKAERDAAAAIRGAGSATVSAKNATDSATTAKQESDSLAKEVTSANQKAADAESHLADALQRAANAEAELQQLSLSIPARRLSQEQKKSLKRLLAGEPKGSIALWSLFEDSETTDFAADLIRALMDDGYMVGTGKLSAAVERPPDGEPVGIEFSVRPGGELTPAAIRVQRAFLAIGIPSGVVEAPNADASGINIIVGHKAIPPIKIMQSPAPIKK